MCVVAIRVATIWCTKVETLLRLPGPFLERIVDGVWHEFCVFDLGGTGRQRGGWRIGQWSGHSLRFGSRKARGQREAHRQEVRRRQEVAATFSLGDAATVRGFLREVKMAVTSLAEQCQVSLQDETLRNLRMQVLAAESYVDTLHHFRRDLIHGSRRHFSVSHLLRCFFLCRHLSNSDSFRAVVINALKICLPAQITTPFIKMWEELCELPVPSSATMSRFRGRLDVTWMLIWRDRFHVALQTGLIAYVGIDSSPQAGRDYMVVITDVVASSEIPMLWDSYVYLCCRFAPPGTTRLADIEPERSRPKRVSNSSLMDTSKGKVPE